MKPATAFGLRWQSAAATALLARTTKTLEQWTDSKRRGASLPAAVQNFPLPNPILKHAS